MKKPRVLASICLGLMLSSIAWSQEGKVFKAGAATSNITPWRGLSLAGNMSDHIMTLVHDELHARALVLDDGSTRLVFVTVDSCMVPREIFNEAKAMAEKVIGIPADHMLMAATHSHTAACSTPVFQSDPDPDYIRFLTRRISDAVVNAASRLQPARIGWGSGSLPDEVHNRRWHMKPGAAGVDPFGSTLDTVKMNPPRASENLLKPAGPIDPEIAFLAVEDLTGKPVALLANYSLHYVGGTRGGEASGDYFAVFADRIGRLLGATDGNGPFVGMMSNGTSGDINNIDFREPGTRRAPYEQMNIVANKAAVEVYRAYQNVTFNDWVKLDAAQRDITLGVRLPSAGDVAEARAIVAAAASAVMRGYSEIYARETILLNEYPAEVPVMLQAMRIGDLAVIGIPCEVFAEIGLELKAKSPFGQTFTMELANGYNGYLPTAKQHGYGGYETWRARSSYLEIHAADKIIKTVLELLGEVTPNK